MLFLGYRPRPGLLGHRLELLGFLAYNFRLQATELQEPEATARLQATGYSISKATSTRLQA
jgi:hypothetical protein